MSGPAGLPQDEPAEAEVAGPHVLAEGHRTFARYSIALDRPDGPTDAYHRDIVLAGSVIGLIPVDLARRELVLLRQFRVAAHVATGRGDMVELVAGRCDPGEVPIDTARRECREEIGVTPTRIAELFAYMPAPGVTDEVMTLYVGEVDAARVPERTGLAGEHEYIRPFRAPLDAVPALLASRALHSGPLMMGLHWLALNGNRLEEMLAGGSPSFPTLA